MEHNKKENQVFIDAGDLFFGGTMESEMSSGEITSSIYKIFGIHYLILFL